MNLKAKERRNCSRCIESHPISDMIKDKRWDSYKCKKCNSEICKKYRNENKEKVSRGKIDWYQRNREKALETRRQYVKNNREKVLERHKKHYRENKDEYRNNFFVKKYGITLKTYNDMLSIQEGKCEICLCEPKNSVLVVDHNHKTGKVRGLLCAVCNFALGGLKEDEVIIRNLIKYIKKYEKRDIASNTKTNK